MEIFAWTEFNRMLKRQITEVSRSSRKRRKADNRICHEISFWLTVTLKLMIIEHSSTQRRCKTTINKQQHKTFSLNFSKNHCINSQRDSIFQHLTSSTKETKLRYFTSRFSNKIFPFHLLYLLRHGIVRFPLKHQNFDAIRVNDKSRASYVANSNIDSNVLRFDKLVPKKIFHGNTTVSWFPVNSWNSRFYEIRSDSELLPSSVHFLSRRKYCSHYSNNPNTVQQSRFEPSNCKYERWRTLLERSWQAGNKTSTKLPSKDTKPYETCPSRFQLFRNILQPKLHAA